VLQSSLEFYRAYGVRIAANTGFPTIVSPLHESEQRDPLLVAQRDRDVKTMYTTPDTQETLRLLSLYRVQYVYVGPIERAAYGATSVRKFDRMGGSLAPVYNFGSVVIYQVSERVWSVPYLPQGGLEIDPGEGSGQVSEATLLRQIELDPQAVEPVVELVRRYRRQGRLDEAAGLLQGALLAHPRDAFLYHLYGDVLRDDGRRQDAEQAYRTAAAVAPTAVNYTKLGIELFNWGMPTQAEEALMQAIALEPNAADPAFYLAQIYERQDLTEQAITYYTRYLNLAAPDARGRLEAEEALMRLRDR
jgi:tetratricopeptide (TPR) repeat protein